MHTVILGNAYLSLAFVSSSDPKLLKQSLSAYQQAVCDGDNPQLKYQSVKLTQERDSGAANNPDLHYNRATVGFIRNC